MKTLKHQNDITSQIIRLINEMKLIVSLTKNNPEIMLAEAQKSDGYFADFTFKKEAILSNDLSVNSSLFV